MAVLYVAGSARTREDATVAKHGQVNWSNKMNESNTADDQPPPPTFDQALEEPPLSKAEADALLEKKRKQGASGLSWDEVVSDNRDGWRQATEMGEGD
jgi:hypothetical protein